jgi:hypothetical protein
MKMMLSPLPPPINEGLGEEGSLHRRLYDEWVGPRIWDVNPVVSSGECDWLLRPMQRLCRLGVDEVDLALILAVASSAHMRLEILRQSC